MKERASTIHVGLIEIKYSAMRDTQTLM